ncbi:MAG: hypothetical protein DHS20C05_00490 [Hyphococcus sp.]|nr:MAG: hypothetical protein DHS20C05_00490 [Marinicaulis sp.]
MIFDEQPLGVFAAGYPVAPAALRHHLTGNPLLDMAALVELTKALPAKSVEYNVGDLPVEQDPDKTPMNGLSAEETVRRIQDCDSWLVLKNIEDHPSYNALLDNVLDEVSALVAADHGPMYKREGFIFISSPGAVTPFHMDPEHNILLQIAGHKTFHLYPANEPSLVSPEQHESFHSEGGHRNLVHDKAYDAFRQSISLHPGDALHVPLKSPHWVQVGDEVSVSLSVTWRSRFSDAEARLHQVNGWLRQKGFNPPMRGEALIRDSAKSLAHRLLSGVTRRLLG